MDKMKKATKMKDFAVTLETADKETKTIEITAQNEKSAIKKALKATKGATVTKIEPAWNQEIFDAAVAGKDTTKMLKAAEKKAVKAAKTAQPTKPKKPKKGGVDMGHGVVLTANQAKAMRYLISEMAGHKKSEPTFSDVGIKQICDLFPTPFVGGAVISTLIEKGLIEKGESPEDNRDILGKYIIHFTDLGQKLR